MQNTYQTMENLSCSSNVKSLEKPNIGGGLTNIHGAHFSRDGYITGVFQPNGGKGYKLVQPKENYGSFSISASVRPSHNMCRCGRECGCNCAHGGSCSCPYLSGVS